MSVTVNTSLRRLSARMLTAAAMLTCFAASTPVRTQTLTFDRVAVGDVRSDLQANTEAVVTEAARRIGIETAFRRLPPLRSVEAANDGETDGILARIADVARRNPNMVLVPTPVAKAVTAVYGATPDIATRSRDDLRRMRFCALRGVYLTDKSKSHLTITEANLWDALVEMLAGGRCELLLVEYFDFASYLRAQQVGGLYRWPYAWSSEPLYTMLHKKHTDLVPRLDAALQQMQKEGLIERAYADGLRRHRIEPPPGDESAADPGPTPR